MNNNSFGEERVFTDGFKLTILKRLSWIIKWIKMMSALVRDMQNRLAKKDIKRFQRQACSHAAKFMNGHNRLKRGMHPCQHPDIRSLAFRTVSVII